MGKDGDKSVFKKQYRERLQNECDSFHSANTAHVNENGSLERLVGSENVDPATKASSAHSSPQLGGKSFSVMDQLLP